MKGARGVVRRAITEIDETVALPQIGRGVTAGAQRQLRRLLESDGVGGDPIRNVVPSVHLLNHRIISTNQVRKVFGAPESIQFPE